LETAGSIPSTPQKSGFLDYGEIEAPVLIVTTRRAGQNGRALRGSGQAHSWLWPKKEKIGRNQKIQKIQHSRRRGSFDLWAKPGKGFRFISRTV
jgi:hypothetical protein